MMFVLCGVSFVALISKDRSEGRSLVFGVFFGGVPPPVFAVLNRYALRLTTLNKPKIFTLSQKVQLIRPRHATTQKLIHSEEGAVQTSNKDADNKISPFSHSEGENQPTSSANNNTADCSFNTGAVGVITHWIQRGGTTPERNPPLPRFFDFVCGNVCINRSSGAPNNNRCSHTNHGEQRRR